MGKKFTRLVACVLPVLDFGGYVGFSGSGIPVLLVELIDTRRQISSGNVLLQGLIRFFVGVLDFRVQRRLIVEHMLRHRLQGRPQFCQNGVYPATLHVAGKVRAANDESGD